jgi:Predicted membrane protein
LENFEVKVFAISSIILFLLALGDQNPLINFLYSTGIIKGLRDPVRALHILPIFVSLFSAYGLRSFLERRDENTILKITLLILAFSIPFLLQRPRIDNSGEILKFFVLIILTYALLRLRGILPNSITALTFFDLYLAGNPYLKRRIDTESYYKPTFVSDLMPKGLGEYRINARFNLGLALPRNSGMINGLELLDGYEPLVSKFYLEYYRNLINRIEGFEKLLDMGNVRFYITEDGFRENPGYLPRSCVFFKAEVVKDSGEFFGNLKKFDTRNIVYLQDEPKGKYEKFEPCIPAKILKYDYTSIILEYSSKREGILYISLPIYPYWRAKIDGKDIRIMRANWTFIALEVPKGSHRIEIHHDKISIILTISLWFLGLLLGISLSLTPLSKP